MYEQFKKLLEREGLKTSDVCKETGIDPSTFSHWKKGDYTPKRETLQKIADFFSVPIAYFYEVEHYEVHPKLISKSIYNVSAGNGAYNDGHPTESIQTDDGYEYCRIVGDSMHPILQDGDLVKIRPQTETESNDLTVIRIDGEKCSVKYVEVTDTGIWVRAENKDVFEDRFYSIQEVLSLPVSIIGRAVAIVERKL